MSCLASRPRPPWPSLPGDRKLPLKSCLSRNCHPLHVKKPNKAVPTRAMAKRVSPARRQTDGGQVNWSLSRTAELPGNCDSCGTSNGAVLFRYCIRCSEQFESFQQRSMEACAGRRPELHQSRSLDRARKPLPLTAFQKFQL